MRINQASKLLSNAHVVHVFVNASVDSSVNAGILNSITNILNPPEVNDSLARDAMDTLRRTGKTTLSLKDKALLQAIKNKLSRHNVAFKTCVRGNKVILMLADGTKGFDTRRSVFDTDSGF